ncbi:hypothetical protein P154DRAFT_535629 [Amniculicola lignicola CBS 123094]|uniref:Uncharacterized protein n=1 Tax=Amniculicola lignicola CBS 123094 TaxID=1392246 RepID=A0A6A5WF40_9PLEO|nr:hypothetical protein P154DRAFT_535629 [Amniculicola lignicola CBS 123094]
MIVPWDRGFPYLRNLTFAVARVMRALTASAKSAFRKVRKYCLFWRSSFGCLFDKNAPRVTALLQCCVAEAMIRTNPTQPQRSTQTTSQHVVIETTTYKPSPKAIQHASTTSATRIPQSLHSIPRPAPKASMHARYSTQSRSSDRHQPNPHDLLASAHDRRGRPCYTWGMAPTVAVACEDSVPELAIVVGEENQGRDLPSGFVIDGTGPWGELGGECWRERDIFSRSPLSPEHRTLPNTRTPHSPTNHTVPPPQQPPHTMPPTAEEAEDRQLPALAGKVSKPAAPPQNAGGERTIFQPKSIRGNAKTMKEAKEQPAPAATPITKTVRWLQLQDLVTENCKRIEQKGEELEKVEQLLIAKGKAKGEAVWQVVEIFVTLRLLALGMMTGMRRLERMEDLARATALMDSLFELSEIVARKYPTGSHFVGEDPDLASELAFLRQLTETYHEATQINDEEWKHCVEAGLRDATEGGSFMEIFSAAVSSLGSSPSTEDITFITIDPTTIISYTILDRGLAVLERTNPATGSHVWDFLEPGSTPDTPTLIEDNVAIPETRMRVFGPINPAHGRYSRRVSAATIIYGLYESMIIRQIWREGSSSTTILSSCKGNERLEFAFRLPDSTVIYRPQGKIEVNVRDRDDPRTSLPFLDPITQPQRSCSAAAGPSDFHSARFQPPRIPTRHKLDIEQVKRIITELFVKGKISQTTSNEAIAQQGIEEYYRRNNVKPEDNPFRSFYATQEITFGKPGVDTVSSSAASSAVVAENGGKGNGVVPDAEEKKTKKKSRKKNKGGKK